MVLFEDDSLGGRYCDLRNYVIETVRLREVGGRRTSKFPNRPSFLEILWSTAGRYRNFQGTICKPEWMNFPLSPTDVPGVA